MKARSSSFIILCALIHIAVVALQLPAIGGTGDLLLGGASWLAAGDLARAREAFSEAARADRLSAVALAGIGAADLFDGRLQRARKSFSDALVLSPNLACANIGLATTFCRLRDYESAMRHYHAALIGRPRRAAIPLAGEAHAACALGLYDTALRQARAALGTDPNQPVARYAWAAASFARGDPRPAAELDAAPSQPGSSLAPPISLASCLLAPGVTFWRSHELADRRRLGALSAVPVPGPAVARPGTARSHATDDFRLVRPREGETVAGAMIVEVAVAQDRRLDYVVVFVNDTFAGHSAVRPYKLTIDTRLHSDGLAEIRADGCGPGGRVICRASTVVKVQNGSRTLAPEERAASAASAELLEELLLPPPAPMAAQQLAGHGLLQLGQAERAASAFESAYAHNAALPGLRADLLLAYQALGLEPLPIAREIRGMPHGGKSVALTFDDGPHPLITPWILDQLDKERVKATFFLVGKQATLYPELVREILRRGHVVGSHSYAHYGFRHLSPLEREQDLVKSRLAIREACGETVRLFRPPGGYCDGGVRASAGALGFTIAFWTCNITSYPGADGRRIAVELARQSADGGIILLHNGEDETLDALPHLIPELRKHGLKFVTLSRSDASPTLIPDATTRGN